MEEDKLSNQCSRNNMSNHLHFCGTQNTTLQENSRQSSCSNQLTKSSEASTIITGKYFQNLYCKSCDYCHKLFDFSSVNIDGIVSWYKRYSVFGREPVFGIFPVSRLAFHCMYYDCADLSTLQQENERNNST